jgi:hypothetical protein
MIALFLTMAGITLGPTNALEVSNSARDAWGACVMMNAAKYATLSEPAETIADAAMSNCTKFEPAFRQSLDALYIVNGPKLSNDTIDGIMSDGRRVFRQHAVGTVLDVRLKKSSKAKGS